MELKSVQNLRSGIFDDNDPKLKKYVACVVTKAGLITESGELNSSALKKSLIGSESEINSILDACSVKKDSVEETSYTMYKCIYGIKPSSLPWIYFFIISQFFDQYLQ